MTTSRPIAHSSDLPHSPNNKGRRVRRQKAALKESDRFVLLMQMGWVVVGLIAISTFPDPRSPSYKPLILSQSTASKALTSQEVAELLKTNAAIADLNVLFINGSESLVARTVGHAEGTRAPDGVRTPAYFGHTDPGNGVWNLGSFSFQHCREPRYNCTMPEQADAFQLERLKTQTELFRAKSQALGLQVTLEEALNAIDLTNQAPLAVIGQPGYPDYLMKARKAGSKGQDAVLAARVKSFWNPKTDRWDAPGLGNTEASIRHDQKRRMMAISRVLQLYQQPVAQIPNQQHQSRLNNQLAANNPYSIETQRDQFLWWDAGYWDGKLNRGRQMPVGSETAYDKGFQKGTAF